MKTVSGKIEGLAQEARCQGDISSSEKSRESHNKELLLSKRMTTSEPGLFVTDNSLDQVSELSSEYSEKITAKITTKPRQNQRGGNVRFKMVAVDKGGTVAQNMDKLVNFTSNDSEMVIGQNATGSLSLISTIQQQSPQKTAEKKTQNKEQICRGSVAHKVSVSKERGTPLFKVKGDRFSELSMATDGSAQGGNTNENKRDNDASNFRNLDAAEALLGDEEKLPPLSHGTSSLRHSENDPLRAVLPPVEHKKHFELHHPYPKDKPYVRYSRDVGQTNPHNFKQSVN